jgi:hypothetical protein
MMASSKRQKAQATKTDDCARVSLGVAMSMPLPQAGAMALAEEAPIDFQAKQDAISLIRRSPGPKLQPKIKRTSLAPSKAKETEFDL